MVTVGASLFLQILTVLIQNQKRGLLTLTELFFVVTLIKPGVDCYRVVKGEKQDQHHAISRHTEMIYIKVAELFAECIPVSARTKPTRSEVSSDVLLSLITLRIP